MDLIQYIRNATIPIKSEQDQENDSKTDQEYLE